MESQPQNDLKILTQFHRMIKPQKHACICDLPQELFMDIFFRVPAKTIGLCRCVSKPWNSLLSEPKFIKTHCSKTQKHFIYSQESLLMTRYSRYFYSTQLNNAHHTLDDVTLLAIKLDLTDHLFTTQFRMCYSTLSFCNGLVLFMDVDRMFWLINPVTKEVKQLPSIPNDLCDADYCPFTGVGYDPVNEEYKVVVLGQDENFVDVYSVSKGTWKRVDIPPIYEFHHHTESGIYVDGCIHWVATRVSDRSVVIPAFDLYEEKFCEVPRPRPNLMKKAEEMDLVKFGGCLGIRSYVSRFKVDFWKMEEYGVEESWTKFSAINPYGRSMVPVCFVEKEKVLLNEWSGPEAISSDRVLYNLEDETYKDIDVHGIEDDYDIEGIFIESLISPHCMKLEQKGEFQSS